MVDIPTPPQKNAPMAGPLPPVEGGGASTPTPPPVPGTPPSAAAPAAPAKPAAPEIPTTPPTAPESPVATRGQINPSMGAEPKVPGQPAASPTLAQSVSSTGTPSPDAFNPLTPGAGIPPAGPMPAAPPVMPPKKKSRMWLWITIIIVLLLIAGGVVYFLFFRTTTSTPATETPSITDGQSTDIDTPADDSDLDNDGLNYAQEKVLGSNPDIFDTDGDGYNDGEEFDNGYSPTEVGDVRLTQDIIDQVNALAGTGTQQVTGESLSNVYSGTGTYACTITGMNGDGTTNIVNLEAKDGKYRGEFTRIVDTNSIKLAYIVDGQKIYFGNADENKYIELLYDPITGVGSSEDVNGNGVPEFRVSGFIFTSETLLTAADPTSIVCNTAQLADERFTVTADQMIQISEASDHSIQSSN